MKLSENVKSITLMLNKYAIHKENVVFFDTTFFEPSTVLKTMSIIHSHGVTFES